MPTEPFGKVTAVYGGDTIYWEGARMPVLDTPGYTRGAVSHVIEIDGKRITCTGDLIYMSTGMPRSRRLLARACALAARLC